MTPRNLPGVTDGILTPRFFGKNIIIILYSETRSRTVFLLSFITDLWTPRNVALVDLTPPVKKIVPARLGGSRKDGLHAVHGKFE